MTWVALFLVFLKASILSVGGLSSLPLLRQDLVASGAVTERQILEALAIGRLSPGPSGLYFVSLGYFAGGFVGSLLALAAGVIPPLIFVLITGSIRRRLMSPAATGIIRGIALSTAGLVVATGIQLLTPDVPLWRVPLWQLGLAAVSTVLTVRSDIHPGVLIGTGAVIGVALGPG